MEPSVAAAFGPIGASPQSPGLPYTCGAESVSGGVLTLTKGALCSAQTGVVANYVTLDPNQFLLVGDFDVQVTFTLTMFPVPSTNRWAGFRISTADATCWSSNNCPGLSIERYDNGTLTPTEYYKIWDIVPYLSNATTVPTSDTTGGFRITRQGSNMLAYYRANGSWISAHPYVANAGPMAIQFYTGSCSTMGSCTAADQVAQSVSFSQLTIALSVQDAGAVRTPDAGAVADGGAD
jgi:hypothetical protein